MSVQENIINALKKHVETKVSNQEALLRLMSTEEHQNVGQYQLGFLDGVRSVLEDIKVLLPYVKDGSR